MKFKKKNIILFVFLLFVGMLLLAEFFVNRTKRHTIEIYTIASVKPDFRLDSIKGVSSDLQGKYKDEYKRVKKEGVEPTVTEKDIVGYNEELRAFMLSDDFRKAAKENASPEAVPHIYGGSVWLGVTKGKKMAGGDFIIAVDGEFLYGGQLEKGGLSSMSSFGLTLSDTPDGFMIGNNRGVWDEALDIDETRLVEVLKDMKIPMDVVPRASDITGEEVYDVKGLWDNRCDFSGDDTKMEALIKVISFPEDVKYQSFERDLDLYIYKNRNYSPRLNGLRIFLSGMDNLEDDWVLVKNAEILFALVGDLDFVEFVEYNDGDAPRLKGFVDSRNKELTDCIMPLSSNVYEMMWTGYKKLESAEELFLCLEPFVIFGESNDYPHLIGSFSHQEEADVSVSEFPTYVYVHEAKEKMPKEKVPTKVYVYEESDD